MVVSTAAFDAGARGSFPAVGGLKETKIFLPHRKTQYCGEHCTGFSVEEPEELYILSCEKGRGFFHS